MVRKSQIISEALKRAISESDKSAMDIERATGVNNAALSRFLRGERSLSLPTVDKLAEHFGLELVKRKARRG